MERCVSLTEHLDNVAEPRTGTITYTLFVTDCALIAGADDFVAIAQFANTKLLEKIDVSGALVTLNAMGCQAEIADRVIAKKVDYRLAVKGSQPTLREGLQSLFLKHLEDDFAEIDMRRFEYR